jgi:CBS domain-containing protein
MLFHGSLSLGSDKGAASTDNNEVAAPTSIKPMPPLAAFVEHAQVEPSATPIAPAQRKVAVRGAESGMAMSPGWVESSMPVTLESLATKIVVTATPEISAARAAQLMRAHHVGSLVVLDGASDSGKPVGILTDRDLVLAVMAEELDPSLFTVGDVMSVELVTAPASASLLDATHELRRHRVRRLIVLDDAGRVVGLAALEDLLEALVRELGELSMALRGAREREIRERQ